MPHGTGGRKIAAVDPAASYLDDLVEFMRQDDPAKRPQTIREVKRELIGQKNTFVENQHLDRLRQTVIKESETDDSLVLNPPELTNVRFTGIALEFVLSTELTPDWISHFQNMKSYGSMMGHGPEYFTFRRNVASVSASDHTAQQVIDYFKSYLSTTNEQYAEAVSLKLAQRTREERRQLESAIQTEQARKRVQSGLRW